MADLKPKNPDGAPRREAALSQWDTEGGAGPDGPQELSTAHLREADDKQSMRIELAQLHVRVIALENLLITLLSEATDKQVELARDLAAFITPRPGSTQHQLTIHASGQMYSLVERAGQIRLRLPS